MGGDSHDPPASASNSNRELVVRLAVGVLTGKGWIEEPDEELTAALRRPYEHNPICQQQVRFTANCCTPCWPPAGRAPRRRLGARTARPLGARPRRALELPCGQTFGIYPFSDRRVLFYTLAADGLFAEQATACPSCGRDLAATREDVPAGQLGLAL